MKLVAVLLIVNVMLITEYSNLPQNNIKWFRMFTHSLNFLRVLSSGPADLHMLNFPSIPLHDFCQSCFSKSSLLSNCFNFFLVIATKVNRHKVIIFSNPNIIKIAFIMQSNLWIIVNNNILFWSDNLWTMMKVNDFSLSLSYEMFRKCQPYHFEMNFSFNEIWNYIVYKERSLYHRNIHLNTWIGII